METNTKVLTWIQLQKEDPKQTALLVDFTWHSSKSIVKRTRVIVGNWASREEAWRACKDLGFTGTACRPGDVLLEKKPRLLRLSKIIRELDATKPKNVSAFKVF